MKKGFKKRYTFKDIKGINTLNKLEFILSERREELDTLSSQVNRFYHPFTKEQGNKPRVIDNPQGKLKWIQTKIGDRILSLYPLSEIIYGAVAGRSTRDNSIPHIKQAVVVRIDLSDCFHSIKSEWVFKCFRKKFQFSVQVSRLLTNLCTYRGSIPVGSPISSMLVNIVMDDMWREIETYCKKRCHTPSVWVDDLHISGDTAQKLIEGVKKIINRHRLRIGWKKLKIQYAYEPQVVTGNTVNSVVGIPVKKRKEIAKNILLGIHDPKFRIKAEGQQAFANFTNKAQGSQLSKLLEIDR